MWIMPDGQSLTRNVPRIKRKRNRCRPLHCAAVTAEARFAVMTDRVMPAPVFNRTLPIFQSLLAAIPFIQLRLEQTEVIVLMIRNRLVFAHAILHKPGWGDVMKLIGVNAQK